MGKAIWTIQQQITAGNNFNKSSPDGSKTEDGHKITYDGCNNGGQFQFDYDHPLEVRRVMLDAADSNDWYWYVESDGADGTNEFVLFEHSDTELNSLVVAGDSFLLLMPGDKLLLETLGGTNSMYAEVSVEPRF
jgi:hypothetical protein